LNVAEKLIEERNTLFKACVKMHPTFAEEQQKVEIELKRKGCPKRKKLYSDSLMKV